MMISLPPLGSERVYGYRCRIFPKARAINKKALVQSEQGLFVIQFTLIP